MVDPYQVLPREIFHQIFLPLDVEDRFNCTEVNKSWRNFITSDTNLWRSSIVFRTECDAEILQKCLDYAFGTSDQSIALDTVRIVVYRENSNPTLRLLSKYIVDQRVNQINWFSLEIKGSRVANSSELPLLYFIYHLVPISNFHAVIHGYDEIRLDHLLGGQSESLIQLYLHCHSVDGYYQINRHINRAGPRVFCPMLKELYLSCRYICINAMQSISGCTNLRLLEVANVNNEQGVILINHLLNNIPNGLQALHLVHLDLYIDLEDEGCEWPKNLISLKLVHSHLILNGGDILGSLEGLRELVICNDASKIFGFLLTSLERLSRFIDLSRILRSGEGLRRWLYSYSGAIDVLEFFDKYKCGPNLRSLSLEAVDQIPRPNLYQNVESLDLSNVSLSNSFLSECYKLTKVKDVHFAYVSPSGAELVKYLITMAKNNVETIHLAGHALSRPDIEKITNLGVTVKYMQT